MEIDKSRMVEHKEGELTVSKMIEILISTMKQLGDVPLTFNIGTMETMDHPIEAGLADVGGVQKPDGTIAVAVINVMPMSIIEDKEIMSGEKCKTCNHTECEKHPSRLN